MPFHIPMPRTSLSGGRKLGTGARIIDGGESVVKVCEHTPAGGDAVRATMTLEVICRKVRANDSKPEMIKQFMEVVPEVMKELCRQQGIDPGEIT